MMDNRDGMILLPRPGSHTGYSRDGVQGAELCSSCVSLDSEPSEGGKAADLGNFPILPEAPTGNMTPDMAFPGKIPC